MTWRSDILFATCAASLLLAASGRAQEAPPAPPALPATSVAAAAPRATAWACTQATLLADLPCAVEGRTAPQGASLERAREHQREARLLGEDVCRTLARAGAPDEDAALRRVCTDRIAAATKRCGGDGSVRLLDDAGRFNPGHARCYGALAEAVQEMQALAEVSSTCCACLADRCGASADRCVERVAAGGAPDAAQCLATTCSASCAVLHLVQRKP